MHTIVSAALPVAAIGLVCGVILALASHLLATSSDEKLSALRAALPGVNCGACGYSGCDGYAQALVSSTEHRVNLCSSGGAATAQALASLLDADAVAAVPMVAHVFCRGSCEHTTARMEYHGIQSCAAAQLLYGGPGKCVYGCLGYGDCAAVCPQDAIHMENGLASVDRSLCLSCGQCAAACPVSVIRCVSARQPVAVSCSSPDHGKAVRQACSAGCLGCGSCIKACPNDAIHLENALAVVDTTVCTGCVQCVTACPVGVIQALFYPAK